jgi:hypothetical protein
MDVNGEEGAAKAALGSDRYQNGDTSGENLMISSPPSA